MRPLTVSTFSSEIAHDGLRQCHEVARWFVGKLRRCHLDQFALEAFPYIRQRTVNFGAKRPSDARSSLSRLLGLGTTKGEWVQQARRNSRWEIGNASAIADSISALTRTPKQRLRD
jgi:hypothetical protein